MGFFSWKTADTNRSISNIHSNRGALKVYLLMPNNSEPIYEDAYEGYGVFGGHDVYELLAKWNVPTSCKNKSSQEIRDLGIQVQFDMPELIKYPLKFVENPLLKYEDVAASERCVYQGYFYD